MTVEKLVRWNTVGLVFHKYGGYSLIYWQQSNFRGMGFGVVCFFSSVKLLSTLHRFENTSVRSKRKVLF